MSSEQLIDLIRQYDVIFNTKSAEYRDISLRNAAWIEVSKMHGKSVEVCKENWNRLRNCYNNAMKRRKRCEKTGKKIPPWRFEKQMRFLKPYMGRRTGNLKTSVSYEEASPPSPESIIYAEMPTSPGVPVSPRPSSSNSNESYKRRIRFSRDYSAHLEMMKSSQESPQTQELDALDTFFFSMSKSVRKLPKVDQIRIKMDLLKAISEAELRQLESD